MSSEIRNQIKENYKDCLCVPCLKELEKSKKGICNNSRFIKHSFVNL
ncbi:hypothetical protein LEP1GSC150_5435 [Leptospira interrogans serovar Copenhageni str. LT2050]|uniref:Uncharacterized protein n=1 Tax=Leptospira interrogans serovar Copenhageni str. LT2050 TaxID=1001598 RepID=M3GC24_LEPIT|nr:hypothetical protein LEP1GSC150_5435 [Leptospira interrogans serovar Copenhageni str. LT2050]